MANDNEIRVLRSALRSLENRQRRFGDDGIFLQIKRLKEMIEQRSVPMEEGVPAHGSSGDDAQRNDRFHRSGSADPNSRD